MNKSILTNWNTTRWVRLIISISLVGAYISTKEGIFLLFGIFFLIQVVFNLSCPGGTCGSPTIKEDQTIYKFKKYNPKK